MIWTAIKALEISYAKIKAYLLSNGIWRDKKKTMPLKCRFHNKSFTMNAPLVS